MNILLIIPEQSGTIARVSYNLYKGLIKLDKTNVYVARLHNSKQDGFPFENVFCFDENNDFCRNKVFAEIKRVLFLKRLKKQLGIDLSISTLMAANVLNVLSRYKDKTVGIFHADLAQFRQTRLSLYLICRFSYKFICSRLNKAVAISKKTEIDMKNHSLKNVQLIYNIHDVENIRKLSTCPLDSIREETLFQEKVVLFVGYLYQLKGVERLIRAFSYAKKNCGPIKLVFVGGDPEGRMVDYLKIINQLGEVENIVFLGEKNNPYKYMARASLLVSSSYDEGMPGVIIESLSLRTPVVATNSSMGIWEIMECIENYEVDIRQNVETKFGYITPNVKDDDSFNIKCLSDAISKSFMRDYTDICSFDISRFEEHHIINKLLSDIV